ncbi:unnamed protein product [Discula destructiva]
MLDISAVPQCGLNCLVASFHVSSCNSMDQPCLCADKVYDHTVTSCVLSNCTVKEGLVIKNATWSGCGFPEQDQSNTILAFTVVLFVLQLLFFGARMLARVVKLAPWGWDDTTITIAFVTIMGWVAASILETHRGLGKNVWTLTPDQITDFLHIFYVFEVIYSFVCFLIKISITFLYMRIFPGAKFRIVLWATQLFLTTSLIAYAIIDRYQCHPISYFWTYWDGEHEGHCLNLTALAYAHAGVNIFLDLWLLVLPATQVWRLNMSVGKRARVMFMFGFGIFATVISCIRLPTIATFAVTSNPTSDFFRISIWSASEITAGLMVACMPAARLFVVRYLPRVFSTQRSRNTNDDESPHVHLPSTNEFQNAQRIESNKRRNNPPAPLELTPKDLDKNRRYSMHVTVTSAGKFSPEDHSEKDSHHEFADGEEEEEEEEEEEMRIPELLEPGSAKLKSPGEYLNVPKMFLEGGKDQGPAQRGIMVTQDISVVHTSPPDPYRIYDTSDEESENDEEITSEGSRSN